VEISRGAQRGEGVLGRHTGSFVCRKKKRKKSPRKSSKSGNVTNVGTPGVQEDLEKGGGRNVAKKDNRTEERSGK